MRGGTPVHRPVLLQEVLEYLAPRHGGLWVDATLGGGGHAAAVLERIGPTGRLVGIDRDAEALELARARLGADPRVHLAHADYRDLRAALEELEVEAPAGILADLGCSSLQLDGEGRGFSFLRDEPLDMRMDRSQGPTAAEWLAAQDEAGLRHVLREYGEERHAGRVARALVAHRDEHGPFRTTGELAGAVRRAVPTRGPQRIDPATRSFQAIRIAVNDELTGLDGFVDDAARLLSPGGRLVIISFHSLEDRQVKRTLRRLEGECTCPPDLPVCGCGRESVVRVLTRRPVRPTESEVAGNPRSRSARLRAAEAA